MIERREEVDEQEGKTVQKWAVLRAFSWQTIVVTGVGPLLPREGDPQWYVPFFDTKEQAEAWCRKCYWADEKEVFPIGAIVQEKGGAK